MHRDLLPGHAGLEKETDQFALSTSDIEHAVGLLLGKAVSNVFVDIANKPVLPASQGCGTEAVGV